MKRRGAWLGALGAAWIIAAPASAEAQPTAPPDGIAVVEFGFGCDSSCGSAASDHRPPVETSGTDASIGGRLGTPVGMRISGRQTDRDADERARLGLEVERGVLSANIAVQDAHVAGYPSPLLVDSNGDCSSTKFDIAYLEAHTTELHPSFVRLGARHLLG